MDPPFNFSTEIFVNKFLSFLKEIYHDLDAIFNISCIDKLNLFIQQTTNSSITSSIKAEEIIGYYEIKII